MPGRFAKAFVPSGMGFDSSSFRMFGSNLPTLLFNRMFSMSPELSKHFDVAITLEDAVEAKLNPPVGAVTAPTAIEEATDQLTKKYFMSNEDLADIVIADSFAVEIFKAAWHDPEYKLDALEELVFNRLMERELRRAVEPVSLAALYRPRFSTKTHRMPRRRP